jgi:hypothetical protein
MNAFRPNPLRFVRAHGFRIAWAVLAASTLLGQQASPPGGAVPQAATDPGGLDGDPTDATRPEVILLVDGGPDETTIWRGWPVFLRVRAVVGPAPEALQVAGPSPVAPTRVAEGWIIAASESARLAPGRYEISAGSVRSQFAVADPPSPLSPELQARRRRIAIWCALAQGDAEAARREAEAWATDQPAVSEAHVALGEARFAARQWPEALAAYREAIRLVPPGRDPPRDLLRRVGEIMRSWANQLPARAGSAPSADENAYHRLIAVGDAARAAGDRTEAARQYGAAIALHQALRLALPRGEAEEKLAALQAPPSPEEPIPFR